MESYTLVVAVLVISKIWGVGPYIGKKEASHPQICKVHRSCCDCLGLLINLAVSAMKF